MARVYREAPLNSVWEGTANMMCMDVRRAMARMRGRWTRCSMNCGRWPARRALRRAGPACWPAGARRGAG